MDAGKVIYSVQDKALFLFVEQHTQWNVYETRSGLSPTVQQLDDAVNRKRITELLVDFKPVPEGSQEFKGKMMFYVINIEPGLVKDNVQRLPGDWTMQEWLEN